MFDLNDNAESSEVSKDLLGDWHLPLITTKFSPPRLAGQLVERSHLLSELSAQFKAALILIEAPAGFGKTTLLSQWRRKLLKSGHTVAWLSLDGDDNTPHRFMDYLASALASVNVGVGDGTRALLQSGAVVPPKVIASILINELDSLNEEVYLVLDDFHTIHNREVVQLLNYFLGYAPENFHLVIASRSEPRLSLANLRARGQIFELKSSKLRFNLEECRQFFDYTHAGQLTSSDIQQLLDATEGWITGLQLAAISPRVKSNAVSLKEIVLGGSPAIASYMDDVVLSSLPEEILHVLLRISLLERFNTSLCQAVAGTEEVQVVLDYLIDNRLFIQPLDEKGEWYRFHHLFADYLRHRLNQKCDDEIQELHRRAYSWFAKHSLWAEAVRHALAAGDSDKAVRWVELCAMTLVESSNMTQLVQWLERLPGKPLQQKLQLLIAQAWSLALLFSFSKAERLITRIEQELPQIAKEEQFTVSFSVHVIKALIAGLKDDTVLARSIGERLLDNWPKNIELPFAVGVLCNVLTFSYLHAGEYEKGKDVQLRALDDDSGRTNLFVTVYRKDLLGLIALKQGKINEASRWFNEALQLAESKEGRRSVASTISACFLAKVEYERNNIVEAQQLLADRWEVIDEGCFIDAAMRGYVTEARIQHHKGMLERSLILLQRAERVATKRGWTRMLAACSAERIRFLLIEGNLYSAKAQLERLQLMLPEDRSHMAAASSSINYFYIVAQARVKIASNSDIEQVLEAVDSLTLLIDELSAVGSQFACNEVKVLLSLAFASIGEEAKAHEILAQTLQEAERIGLKRIFIDEGEPMMKLLKSYRDEFGGSDYLNDILEVMLAEFGPECIPEVFSEVDEEDVNVTEREKEILSIIEKGLSNKEIAQILQISLGTVKWHIKNIYRKLEVSNRTQAVNEAKVLKIL